MHMHNPISNIQAEFENNRPSKYRITTKKKSTDDKRTDRQTDGQTDRQTDGQTDRQTEGLTEEQTSHTTTIGRFFEERKNYQNGITWRAYKTILLVDPRPIYLSRKLPPM